MRLWLAIHVMLILLASTGFTVVTWLTGGQSFRMSFWSFSWSSVYGRPYVSDYSLAEVLTYLAAFGVGLVGFAAAYRAGRWFVCGAGAALAAVGLLSFLAEGAHWLFPLQRSSIFIAPAAMIVLGVLGVLGQGERRSADQSAGANAENGLAPPGSSMPGQGR